MSNYFHCIATATHEGIDVLRHSLLLVPYYEDPYHLLAVYDNEGTLVTCMRSTNHPLAMRPTHLAFHRLDKIIKKDRIAMNANFGRFQLKTLYLSALS